ncbi:MAG: ABC transporter permease [Candidatus Thorarchaeota archaeon]|nr:ABC transporter permease [Candidatus Thorarchaeota archaeon]
MDSVLTTRLRNILTIARKNMLVYYRRGPTLIFGLLFPFFFFLSFVLGRSVEPAQLMPGLLGMVIFFASTAVGPVIIPTETRGHTLERLVALPVPFWAILLGDTLSSIIFSLISCMTPIVLALLVVEMTLFDIALMLIGVLFGCVCFSLFGLLLSSPATDQTSTIMMLSTMTKFPLVFISGVFVPLQSMPSFLLPLTLVSPLTYIVDIQNTAMFGTGFFHPLVSLFVVALSAIVLWILASMVHQRTLQKRF